LLTPHPSWLALGDNAATRAAGYGRLFEDARSNDVLSEIRVYLQQQRVLGSTVFQRSVEATLERFAGVRAAHRPRKLL
jgi:putative transposase